MFKIEETGIPRNQAEAQVQMISELVEMNFATKQDLALLEAKLLNEINVLRQEFASLEQHMTIKLGTIVSLAIGIAVALAKLIN